MFVVVVCGLLFGLFVLVYFVILVVNYGLLDWYCWLDWLNYELRILILSLGWVLFWLFGLGG